MPVDVDGTVPDSEQPAKPLSSAKSPGADMCHRAVITNSIFSAMQEAAKSITEMCVDVNEVTDGAGAAVAGAAASTKRRGVQSSSFSSMYLHRDGGAAADDGEEKKQDTGTNVDVSSSVRMVLRVICVTLPNLAYVQSGGPGMESGVQRVPAVVPFRYAFAHGSVSPLAVTVLGYICASLVCV
jgi:hypothetical protein